VQIHYQPVAEVWDLRSPWLLIMKRMTHLLSH